MQLPHHGIYEFVYMQTSSCPVSYNHLLPLHHNDMVHCQCADDALWMETQSGSCILDL